MSRPDILPAELIKKTRQGIALEDDEIRFLISEFTAENIPDYQMAAWLMAVYFRGLTDRERLTLTQSMLHSGRVIDLSDIPGFTVDKHSTGGVGDKTSLIIGPIVAACGAYVPMISGRGLGHTGGTLDKLESIPGFRTQLSLEEFCKDVKQFGVCFIGQTPEICPADKKMYALRDVTATVESLPLICGSIMSKKLAEGIQGLVLDVKVGSGAFMKTLENATALAEALITTGRHAGLKMAAVLTQMDQPLGTHIGNALEVEECLAILRNEPASYTDFHDTRQLSVHLAAEMLLLANRAPSFEEAEKLANDALTSGRAMGIFEVVIAAQGGSLKDLPKAKLHFSVKATKDGYISAMNTEEFGMAAIHLGAGRRVITDPIDPVAGIVCRKKIGASVKSGDELFTLYAGDAAAFEGAAEAVLKATTISLQKPKTPSLILKRMV